MSNPRSHDLPGTETTLLGSVRRALRLVDVVANESRPVTPKALARHTGLTLGTTYNIVRTLIHEGYLSQEPDGLVLGPRFPALRPREDDGVFLARVRSALHEVVEVTGATAYLSRYSEDDGEVHLVDIVDARRYPRVELWVGAQDSAHATALGKQILAELPGQARLDYLSRHPLAELTPHTISDQRALLAQLDRLAGATIDREEYALGFTCLAVPVRAPGVIASLAISLPKDAPHAGSGQFVPALQQIAAKLALRLGTERFSV
ncbi:MAG: IclR family transcriptional regulator [Streptosporangiales bacterium]|nr:IclR family transcriptional regulator [Streptosporangiales bacterium]